MSARKAWQIQQSSCHCQKGTGFVLKLHHFGLPRKGLRDPVTSQRSKFGHGVAIQETMVTGSHNIYSSNVLMRFLENVEEGVGRSSAMAVDCEAEGWPVWVNGHFCSYPHPPGTCHGHRLGPRPHSVIELVLIIYIGTRASRRQADIARA